MRLRLGKPIALQEFRKASLWEILQPIVEPPCEELRLLLSNHY